jgi:hypothetical protein
VTAFRRKVGLDMRALQLTWRSPRVLIATVDGRELDIVGSESIEGDVHYFISPRLITRWADGEPLDPGERDSILRDVVAAARERGWNFVIKLSGPFPVCQHGSTRQPLEATNGGSGPRPIDL